MIITDVELVRVSDSRADFDGACRSAVGLALAKWGVSEYGHFEGVPGADRSDCSVEVEFVGVSISGGMGGWGYLYSFRTWVERHGEEWDEGDEEVGVDG